MNSAGGIAVFVDDQIYSFSLVKPGEHPNYRILKDAVDVRKFLLLLLVLLQVLFDLCFLHEWRIVCYKYVWSVSKVPYKLSVHLLKALPNLVNLFFSSILALAFVKNSFEFRVCDELLKKAFAFFKR